MHFDRQAFKMAIKAITSARLIILKDQNLQTKASIKLINMELVVNLVATPREEATQL